jgi:hypothetical protein
MELAIVALTLSVISGLGSGICAWLYLRKESLQEKNSEEIVSLWRVGGDQEQFLAVKDKDGTIIEKKAIKDLQHFDSQKVEDEVKKVVISS